MKFAGYTKVDIEEEKLFFRFFGNLVLQNSRVLVESIPVARDPMV